MVKQSIQERRQAVRAKRVLSIQLRLVKSSRRKNVDRSWCLSTTQDMGIGGVAFYSETEYSPNDILELHITMSGFLDIYKGFGKVSRVERKKTGAYFLTAVKYIRAFPVKRSAKAFEFSRKPKAKKKKRI